MSKERDMTPMRTRHRLFPLAILGCFVLAGEAQAFCEHPQDFEARRQALLAAKDTGLYSGPDVEAMPIHIVKAKYPLLARLRNQEGWVQVHFNVSPEGKVIDPVVVASSQPEIFDEAALEAISQWRYQPKIENSVPVARKDMDTIVRLCPED